MNVRLIALSMLVICLSAYSYVKMPGEVRRIQSARAKQKSRYTTLGIEVEPACSLLEFWVDRINEGLSICSALEQGYSCADKALVLRDKFNLCAGIRLKKDVTVEEFGPLMTIFGEMRDYYQHLICSQFKPLSMLARHFIVELEYVVDLLSGIVYTDLATIQFLNRLNIAQVWIIKNLLISSNQRCLIKQAYHLMCHAKRWHCESELLSHTIEILPEFCDYYELLKERLKAGTLCITISPCVFADLMEHFIKIGRYTSDVLKLIKK